jgi:hypothetical protein
MVIDGVIGCLATAEAKSNGSYASGYDLNLKYFKGENTLLAIGPLRPDCSAIFCN